MSRSALHPFTATILGGGTIDFTQLKNFQLSTNPQKSHQIPGGTVDVLCSYLASAGPVATYTTHDLITFFSSIGPASVLNITDAWQTTIARVTSDSNGPGGPDAFIQEGTAYGFKKATIVPLSLSASQGDVDGVTLQFAIVMIFDGETPPVIKIYSAEIGAPAAGVVVQPPACVSKYFFGPVFLGTEQMPNLTSWNIDFGINYDAKPFNGSPFPVEGAIMTRRPEITLTSTALEIGNAQNLFIRGADPLRLFAQRSADNDDRLPHADPVHMRFGIDTGSICEEDMSIQGNDDGTVSLKVTPHGLISVNIASAIA